MNSNKSWSSFSAYLRAPAIFTLALVAGMVAEVSSLLMHLSQIHHALSCHVAFIKKTYTKRPPFESDLKFAYGLTLPSRKDMGGGRVQGFFGVEPILQGACTQNCRMAEAALQIVSASQI